MNDCTNLGRLQAQAADHFRKILSDITAERGRQDAKWGEQNHDFPSWLAILQEELGEMSKSFLKATFTAVEAEGARRAGQPVDETPTRVHAANFRTEMIQTTAVLVAMLECGDRNGWWPR